MFKDKRGIIQDLYIGKDFSITLITFKKGAVRGNHYHEKTKQWDFLLQGKLKAYRQIMAVEFADFNKGDWLFHDKWTAHAYKASKDSIMLSICIGKRIGKNYEKDTYRLNKPLV